VLLLMSSLPPIVDIVLMSRHVRFGSNAEMRFDYSITSSASERMIRELTREVLPPPCGTSCYYHGANPGIGTPNVCRIRTTLSSNTTAVATVAAIVVSRPLAN
jgi:hypothetical protein